ncbi:unnamed protein product [Discosporangium mesarthrocarpum]
MNMLLMGSLGNDGLTASNFVSANIVDQEKKYLKANPVPCTLPREAENGVASKAYPLYTKPWNMRYPLTFYAVLLFLLQNLGRSKVSAIPKEVGDIADPVATKWDDRPPSLNGCTLDGGCLPKLTRDGLLNYIPASRWSCALHIDPPSEGCAITYDLGRVYSVSAIIIYMHKADDEDRAVNQFDIMGSLSGTSFDAIVVGAENHIPSSLGNPDLFPLPSGTVARFIKLEASEYLDFETEQWLSISEVQIMVEDIETPSPSIGVTPVGVAQSPPPTLPPAPVPTLLPLNVLTPAPVNTPVEGVDCASAEITGAGDFDGTYIPTSMVEERPIFTKGGSPTAFTLSAEVESVICQSTGADGCTQVVWTLSNLADDSISYRVYDDAMAPEGISHVWWRVTGSCASATCVLEPADISLTCLSVSGIIIPGPTEVVVANTEKTCTTLEVTGVTALDGSFALGSGQVVGRPIYNRFEEGGTIDGVQIRSSLVTAENCEAPAQCEWTTWTIQSSSDNQFYYSTFSDALQPVDIPAEAPWYYINTNIKPYDEEISIVCADRDPNDGDTQTYIIAGIAGGLLVLLALALVVTRGCTSKKAQVKTLPAQGVPAQPQPAPLVSPATAQADHKTDSSSTHDKGLPTYDDVVSMVL